MMTSTIRKFGVGVASLAMVAGVAAPAVADPAFDPSPFYNVNELRLSGADRVATSIAFAKKVFGKSAAFGGKGTERVAYLAGFDAPADSATAGALGAPIILVKADGSSNADVIAALNSLNVEKVIALGGEKVVPQELLEKIAKGANDASTGRLGGADRYETSVKIAERWSDINSQFTPNKVVLANGITLVDALTAGSLGWPILLADEQGKLPQSVIDYLNQVKPLDYIAVGGERVMPEATVKNAQATSLKSDEVSTDDSLPILKQKAAQWQYDITGKDPNKKQADKAGLREKAEDAASMANAAASQEKRDWDQVSSAANELGKAVKSAKRAADKAGTSVPATGDTWAKYVATRTENPSATDGTLPAFENKVVETRDNLAAVINRIYGLDAENQISFAGEGKIATLATYVRITGSNAEAQKGKLEADFVQGAVDKAVGLINTYYRTKIDTEPYTTAVNALNTQSPLLGAKVMLEGEYRIPRDETHVGVNAFQLDMVAKHVKGLIEGSLSSAESTLRAINLKIAGVADQVDGKSYWRIAGKDRYGTAAGVSVRMNNLKYGADPSKDAETSAPVVNRIYLVNGSAFADATVAGSAGQPVLLINPDGVTIPKVTNDEIIRAAKDYRGYSANKALQVWAVGGTKVVTETALSNANATAVIAHRNAGGTTPETKTTTPAVKYTLTGSLEMYKTVAGLEATLDNGNPKIASITNLKVDGQAVPAGDAGAGSASAPGVKVASDRVQISTANTEAKEYVITFDAKLKDSDETKPTKITVKVVGHNIYQVKNGELTKTTSLVNTTALDFDLTKNGATTAVPDAEISGVTLKSKPAGATDSNHELKLTTPASNNGKVKLESQFQDGKVTAPGKYVYQVTFVTGQTIDLTVDVTPALSSAVDVAVESDKKTVVLPSLSASAVGDSNAATAYHLLDDKGTLITATFASGTVDASPAQELGGVKVKLLANATVGQYIMVKMADNTAKLFKIASIKTA